VEHTAKIQEMEKRFQDDHREHEDKMLTLHKSAVLKDSEHRGEIARIQLKCSTDLQDIRKEGEVEREKVAEIHKIELETAKRDYDRQIEQERGKWEIELSNLKRALESEVEREDRLKTEARKSLEGEKFKVEQEGAKLKRREHELLGEIEEIKGRFEEKEERYRKQIDDMKEIGEKSKVEMRAEFERKTKV